MAQYPVIFAFSGPPGNAPEEKNARSGIAKNPDLSAFKPEHVDALGPTLARESRHIVASLSLGTISRAAVLILACLSVRRKRPVAFHATGGG